MDVVIPASHTVKIKESEKIIKFLDFAMNVVQCRIWENWRSKRDKRGFEWNLYFSRFFYWFLLPSFGLVGRVFTNGPGDLGSIPGHVIPKTLKMVLDTFLLNTRQYKVRIKGKVGQSRERSSDPHTTRCCSYWKGSLLVALDYGRQLYFAILLNIMH